MNTLDLQYQDLLFEILHKGVEKQTRSGPVLSVFGRQITHDMREGFPLLTTKKMAWKQIVTELLWFLRGDTNIKFLVDNGCHIWDGDAYKAYKKIADEQLEPDYCIHVEDLREIRTATQAEFVERLKKDAAFMNRFGDLGPIYGHQWRNWQGYIPIPSVHPDAYGSLWCDQIARLIHNLKTDPDSRRLLVNSWNVAEIDKMVLPPCHYSFQVYTRKLTFEELWCLVEPRYDQMMGLTGAAAEDLKDREALEACADGLGLPIRAISLMWNQRSVDTPLGLPFNIASYGLLLELLAKEVNMVPDKLIGNLGDCHIYTNQVEGVKQQLQRDPFNLPTVQLDFDYEYVDGYLNDWEAIKIADIKLKGYQSHPAIEMPLSN